MLLGDGRAARRTNRVLPDPSTRSTAGQRRSAGTQQNDPDVITTARPSQNASTLRNTLNPGASIPLNDNREDRGHGEETTSGGMMRQWVSELTGGTRPGAGGVGTVRAPSQAEVQTLTTMFPDVGRDVILGVLQRRYVMSEDCIPIQLWHLPGPLCGTVVLRPTWDMAATPAICP